MERMGNFKLMCKVKKRGLNLGLVQTNEKNHSSHIIVVVFWVMGPMIWRLPVVRQGYDF